MTAVHVTAPAKINLHLGVGPLREDGYHDLTTVFESVALHDDLTAEPADDISLVIHGEGAHDLPTDRRNLAVLAATELAAYTGTRAGARLTLTKRIPVAGGLAGGSTDAAAALIACNRLWNTGLTTGELDKLAAALGSDVPFCLHGGTALGTGRGEQLTPVLTTGRRHWVIAIADTELSTPVVYREVDRLRAAGHGHYHDDPAPLLAALRVNDTDAIARHLHNDMQHAALSLRPQLTDTLEAGLAHGALAALVSGSGPTCVFLARTEEHATTLAERLRASGTARAVHTGSGPAGADLT
ncbi:4-diphosphocytidyl-2-C-methyl-D-erythritol kinase [Actinorhabdospora filicis]|uniref:4-diphosphocytidyl-2-C-methyl-D-erythritol kinase n=1 Tax=Actinorhabdospora filicis TaxID=1785913 RepID=A0A9W6SG99_9ACTN|nr:4-diphosphocytidyl-2-C-methyl-D-erythritol kinase [Actinorhabdospora filicis]